MTPPHAIEWLEAARMDVRKIDRLIALQIFEAILRFAQAGAGDIEPLHGKLSGTFRLRVRDYRVFFRLVDNTMQILGVRHRSVAYE